MTVTIYHNPRCSKSRQTLELLTSNGINPRVIEYLKTPLTVSEIESLLEKLDMSPATILRTKEPEYKEAGLDKKDISDHHIIDAIIAHPKLLERPIVVNGDKAAIGRPPESVLEIL